MSYLDHLKQDHEDIQTVLAIMAEMSNRLGSESEVDPADLVKVVTYLDEFVLRGHLAKEERFLYPAVAETGLPADSGPLAVMIAEHQMAGNFLAGLREAAGRWAPGDEDTQRIIGEYARNFALLLAQHMEEEEQVVYPMAEQRLSSQMKGQLEDAFRSYEFQVMGPSGHDKYHAMAHDLAQLYLN